MSRNCPRCAKEVYQAEEVKAVGRLWHQLCFKCVECKKQLVIGGFHEHNKTDLYCGHCHKKNFGGESQAGHEGEADVSDLSSDIKAKIAGKYDAANEKVVRDWINAKMPGSLEDGDAEQFAAALKDGVLLCQLLNVLRPGACKNFKPKAKMAFIQMENISAFLKALTNVWSFKPSDLFMTVDLYEAKNMTSVVDTLLQLKRKTGG
jgi:hypothetical protein